MHTALERVFSPLRVGGVELPNRIVRTAHGTGMARDHISDEFIAYHLERGKGGCGLSILEAGSVHFSSLLDMPLDNPDIVTGYRRLADAIRPTGMKIFQQLWHGGNLYPGRNGPPLAVTTKPGFTGLVGRPMTDDEAWDIIAAFADIAGRCQEGGLDGIELHAGHGYLFQQFLSKLHNDREDQWGGCFENRTRFLRETLRAVRRRVGPNFPIGVRLSASEAPGGITEAENALVLQSIQAEPGLIDFVDVSKGDYFRFDTMVGTMHNPTGYELSSSLQIASVATIPRIVTGRFRTLAEAEEVLRAGDADLISMVRAQIADPRLVIKTKEGRENDVRPCIACNQGCVGGAIRSGRLGCTVNPVVGSEALFSEDLITKTDRPLTVLVVGGGPAGMEAARVAALSGHRVTLVEAGAHLGGGINLARRAPKLHTVGDIIFWLEAQLRELGVDILCNTYLDAGEIMPFGADAVIIATGSMPRMDGTQFTSPGESVGGLYADHILSANDVFEAPHRDFGKSALILDTRGHLEAIAVAEHFLCRGMDVTWVTPECSIMSYAQSTWRDVPALERFYRLGNFVPLPRHMLVDIKEHSCLVRPTQGPGRDIEISADTVVLVTQNMPLRGLYDELRASIENLHLVGDALSPRDAQAAIADGHRAARSLG